MAANPVISFFVRLGRFSVPTFILRERRAQERSRLAVAVGEQQTASCEATP